MRGEEGKALGWLVFIVLVLAGGGYFAWGYWSGQENITLVYRQVSVSRGDISVKVLCSGVVEPENRLEIKPPISGRVDEVLVDEGAQVEKGRILAWISSTERAALLDAARAHGGAEVKRWEGFYKATPVMAPISGMIIVRSVEPGQTFSAQDAVFVMSDHLVVKAQVDETDMAQVNLGQAAVITLDAYPDQEIAGRVAQIAFEATTVNNVTTYIVDVLPDAPSAVTRSGMTANVSFAVETKKGVLLLPAEAVKAGKNGPFVLVAAKPVSAGGQVAPEQRAVGIGLSDGKHVEITSGLNEGEAVLLAEQRTAADGPVNPFMPFRRKRN